MNYLINELKSHANPQRAKIVQRYFKTGKGEYAEGDIFLGVPVPLKRKIANKYQHLEINQLEKLLENKIHDIRFCALLIMITKTKINPEQIYNLYLSKTKFINNWDLVDVSAEHIVGKYLQDKDCSILYSLAQSPLLWERRIAIIATYAFIKQGLPNHTLQLAKILINDKQDLMHKAVGWMLREVGKRCSSKILENFLEDHATTMPRTMLRYAIEKLPQEKKNYFMTAKSLNMQKKDIKHSIKPL